MMVPRRKLLGRLYRDCRGNVAVMFAAALLPLSFLIGMAIDYTMASDRQAQLNGFADAAALSAVTPAMMAQSDTTAQTTAENTFNAQATQLSHIVYSATNLNVGVSTNANGTRTAVVTYTAASPNFFATLLGEPKINIGGSSTATGGLPPNINFYLLLDDSPSMAIAATSAGIQQLINHTQGQVDPETGSKGCAFACHEQQPSKDNLGLPSGQDNYYVAKHVISPPLELRIDLVQQAVKDLMTNAQTTENNTTAQYQMAIYTFDVAVNTIQTLTSSLSTAQTSAGNIKLLEVCYNNDLVCGTNNNDRDTDYDNAMNQINKTLPNPGSGTNAKGDTPQEVLFLVTDGVEDACETPTLNSYSGGGCREQYYMNADKDWCATIKARGIRIAVLYTTYVPMLSGTLGPLTNYTSGWYKNFNNNGKGIESFITSTNDQAATALQACASPGLYTEVQTDGDISAALTNLFNVAVQSAYLAK